MKRTVAATLDNRQVIFWSLFALLSVIFIFYASLLNKTIADIVYVEENQKEVIAMRSSLSDLEKEYLIQSATITIEHAKSLGFVDDVNPSFIKAPGLRSEVSLGKSN